MSLLKKVKARLSQQYEKGKEQRQQKQVKQVTLHKAVEEARWQGYRKGAVARARKEAFRQAKSKPSGDMLGGFVNRSKAGVNFMNQDFGTVFGDMNPDFGARVFGGQRVQAAKPKEANGKSEKGVTIHVNGTTIHVAKKESKKTVQQKRIVRKKKPKNNMLNLLF